MKYVYRHGKRIAVDPINTTTPPHKKRKLFEVSFVKLPHFWIERLKRSKNPGTFKLAFQILKEEFKRQHVGGEIVVSTEATELPRGVRRRAVRELVQLGLIETEQNGNQAIRVTNLLLKEKKFMPIRPRRFPASGEASSVQSQRLENARRFLVSRILAAFTRLPRNRDCPCGIGVFWLA